MREEIILCDNMIVEYYELFFFFKQTVFTVCRKSN